MPELALGTAQFGLAYGVAGRGEPVPEAETRAILHRAWELGIRRLDTAPAYGDIEARLADLCGGLAFSIVSKIAPIPAGATDAEARDHAAASVALSRDRLDDRLQGLLFHNADDLAATSAEAAWAGAESAAAGTPLGLSCYGADALAAALARFPVAMAQLPGNALDQSILSVASSLPPLEITLRSIFLQGLLLMPVEAAAAKMPAARATLERWHGFCAERGLAPLAAALAVAKGLPSSYCVIGVDTAAQLEDVVRAWSEAGPVAAPWLDVRDARIIDPRCWSRD
jgi:aryl-alcohol dehydrogenase-like predicted oxidoreductase